MDIQKQHFKFDGLNHQIDLEKDKIQKSLQQQLKDQEEEMRLKEKHRNRHFDPDNIEVNLPDIDTPMNHMFDPDYITFNK